MTESGETTVGIGHTRWSTHGPPTVENAHPHTDESSSVAVVHNGIIKNHDEIRAELQSAGVSFTSETDTEVVPHLIKSHLDAGKSPEAAFRAAVDRLEGSYAIAAIIEDTDQVFATRNGSPLALGIGTDTWYLASDVPAFLEFTDRAVYLEDDDVVIGGRSSIAVTDASGTPVEREVQTIDWDPEEASLGEFDHYMQKEIHAQPASLRQTIDGRLGDDGSVELADLPTGAFADVDTVHLVGCGTSYHAASFVETVLRRAGVRAEAIRSNGYEVASGTVDERTLFVAVTQSGETADTLSALETANDSNARTVALTNVVGSSVTRAADDSVFIRAGPEIGVAATKTFSSQVVTLVLLAHRLISDVDGAAPWYDSAALFAGLRTLPDDVRAVLDSSASERVAERFIDADAMFFIGRGISAAVAREGALKFKEITYEHAEGFASGQLKHGPLALVTEATPVVAVLTGDDTQDEKVRTNASEAAARGAPIIPVTPDPSAVEDLAADCLTVPETHPVWCCLLGNVHLQLLAYHTAVEIGRPIDKPRNLAKSVTVE
jgi:glucosamine--fructose-6-phosphate aminotransferase (isomerizing)